MDEHPLPHENEAHALRAPLKIMVDQRRIREAMVLCEKVRPDFPRDPWLATMHGYLHLRLGQHAKALQISTEALQLGSQDPTAIRVIGIAHRALGNHSEAAAALLAVYRKLPNSETACMLLEETVAAHDIDSARPVLQEISAGPIDRRVTACWARLLFRAGLEAELPAGYRTAPLMTVTAWMAKAGLAMDWLGEREGIPIEEPPANSWPDARSTRTMTPGYIPYVCTLPGATIFSKSNTILMPDGTALNEMAADEEYGQFINFMSDIAVVDRAGPCMLLDVDQYRTEELDAGIMLSGSVSEHFGHWVPEFLSKLYYLGHHPRFADLPIIVDSQMPPQHFEYLEQLVSNRLVRLPAGGAFRCEELIVASPSTFFPVHLTADHRVPPHKQGGFSLDCIRYIRKRVLEGSQAPSSADRKLYLSRRKRGGRRPLNEDEISTQLSARGFEIVFTEEMSFAEQVELFRSAKAIVAPNGSAVLNAIFSPTDVTLFILSQRGLFNWGTYYGLMRELGYEMSFVCSDDDTGQKHSNYTLPLDRLLEALSTSGMT